MDVPDDHQAYQRPQDQGPANDRQGASAVGQALAGNQDAREWMLDLKEIALAVQAEQNQTSTLLRALHGFVMRQAEQGALPQPAPSP